MNRQFTINDVFMSGITGGEPDRVRQAFHAPDLLSGSEIGQRDNAAEQLGMSYGEADAGWEDASAELKIRKAEAVPGADKWVQDAPENVTFLQEDADGLMAVYDSLRQSGFLSEDDLDEGTAEEIAQSGHGLVDTLERSRLANERTDLGAAVLEGSLAPEEARAKLADIDNRMASLAKRRNDPAGFYSFVEQGYRMVSRDLPQAGYRALEGGLAGATAGMAAGAIAGTAVPVVGNLTGAVGGGVAGGIAGVGAGISRGMYESAQRMESANFLADLLNEKDDAGNYLDVDEIREKAQLYGMGSALVEMAGDVLSVGAAKLIAPFLKTAAANLGGRTLSLFTKDAIKAAIKNKQTWPVMRRFLLGVGAGAAAEGAEEAVQEGVSASIEAWLKNSLNEDGKAYFRDEQEGFFSADTWAAMAESGLEGAKVGAWFVLLPGIAQLFVDAGKVSRAREFAQGVKDVGAVVANSATAQMAPARMDTFLQTHGLNQTVYIPADAAWQMQTQGTDLVTALGWTQESLEEAASLRHDIAVPLSRLVSRLDSGTLNSVADIMREGPNAMNVFEAEEPNSFLQEDVEAISTAAEEWEFEQDMLDAELDRVRTAITEAVRSVPGLLQQIVGSADTETSVGTYVDTIVKLIEQAANRLRVYGDDVGSIIQKLNFEGLVRGADGRLHTAEEIEQMVAEDAQAEADRPFWDNVWGRLDADSLKRDFPDARRELAKKHGYGLFSRKGEGVAVDELADILKIAGWLEQDADSSTLVEMLKSKKRPKARKAVKAAPALRQDVAANSLGVPMERVTVFDRALSRKEMDEALAALAGQNLENKLEGLYAQVNLVQRKKLRSAKAIDKSIDNGFGGGVHLSFAAKIKNLWTWAARATLDENAPVQRFVAPIRIGDEDNFAWLTVKKSDEGLRIYSLELMDKEKLARTSQRVSTEEPKALPLASFEEIIERMGRPVNDESPLYQFIGEAGAARLDEAEEATYRLDNLSVAREMEEAGKDAAAIKLATGWERGADGKWRYEIDDSLIDITGYKARRRDELEADPNVKVVADAVWMKSLLEGGASIAEAREAYREKFGREPEQGAGRLSQQTEGAELLKMERQLTSSPSYKLRHFITPEAGRELYAAHPELADMDIELSNEESQNRGAYFPNTDSIVLYDKNLGDYKGMTGTLLHEVQHAIQRREGFASGGNEKTARALASKSLRELLEVVGFEAETYTRNAEELAAIEFGLDRIRFAEKPSLFEKTGEYLRVKPFAMPKDKKERASALESLVNGWIQERSAEFRSLGHGWWAEYADKQELVERRKKLKAENRKLAQSSKDAARATQLLDKLDEMSDYDIYHSLAGEVEARNTARRMNMTYEERLASLASSTEDVARKDQIFIRDGLSAFAALEQRAWHGTPHKFDAFDLSFMGAGEGAQAHGWGLYFAQDKRVSEGYRERLAKKNNGKYEITIGGEKPIGRIAGELSSASAEALEKAANGDLSGLRDRAQRVYDGITHEYEILKGIYDEIDAHVERAKTTPKLSISGFLKTVPENLKYRFKAWADYAKKRASLENRRATGQDFLESMKIFTSSLKKELDDKKQLLEYIQSIDWDTVKVKAPSEGQLFEVEIPDNDVLLDEQLTYNKQPEKVRVAIEQAIYALDDVGAERPYPRRIIDQLFIDGSVTGKEIYNAFMVATGSDRSASLFLNRFGVKGITYSGALDGRCFVVFDDKAIEVIDKLYAMQAASSHTYKTAEIKRLDDGDFLIRLFRGANLSTLAHEISHAVHLEMERLDSEGKGTDALKRDLDTLRRWQAKFDDEAALRAEYDRYYKGLYGVKFDDLDAVGKLAVKQRAQREMVARGFELYLREGEAPTPGMEAVFRRMGKWMKRVYQNASQLDVEISDDVRGVFDRWLASEEDIAAAAAANDIHGFTAPLLDSLGLQGADRLEVEGMVADAMGKASDALRRERARYRRDHVQQWRDEVEQELAADPVYQARAAMRRTPIDLDAVVDAYGQELADALRVKLPASMKKGGDNPEALAFDYGFRDAGQMIQAILNRPGTQERRKELLAQKMQDADAQFAAEDFLFEQEELRTREDKIGEALYRLELESRTAMGRPVAPSQQDFEDFGSAEKNRWKIAREQLRTLVSNLLDEKEAQAAIQPDSYRRAASKAMRDERRAILAKDWAEAVKQNYLARVNMEAAYQAGKRRDLVNKLRRQSKRFLDSATPDTRARFAVFGLSQKISLFDPTMKMVRNAADKSLDDVREFLEKMKDEGFYTVDAQIPEDLFEGKKQSWKLMDWKDLQPYLEGMAVLMHMERESRKANSDAAKQAWREEMDALVEGILALNPHRNPPADQKKRLDIVRFLKGVHASHLKAETIALLLDGDQDMGPVWRAMIAPINRAQADRDRRMKQARDEVKKLFSVYEPSEWVDIRGKRIFVPGLGRGLTKEQMLAVMLNAGNESNLERLRGMGYKDNEIRAIIDMLDERDVRFVQNVWDYLETFRKESFDLEESLSGVRPQAIEAKPLQTRFGELRGGYYPVSYDPQESSKPIDEESLGTLTGSMMPAVDHGSMKQRTATGLGTPLKLTLEVVPNHVAKTLHMLAFREPVRQVARVLNDKAVNAAIESTMGVEISKALKGWLHYVAGERPGVNGWSKALSMLRKNSALYSMGVKLTTILAQFTGLLASTAEIGPRWVAAGLVRTYCRQNPFTVYRETAALSTMMENRMKSVDRDLYEMSTGLMAKGSSNKALDKFVKFQHLQEQYAFLPVGFVQMAFADLPTWQGAYAKALHEGRSQSEAIEYADAIVTRTQVGGSDKDLAGVQRGQELGKIMTQFYSYFSALYQLYARRMTMLKRSDYSREAWARLATLFLLTGVAEPILSALFTRDTPEDDEDWAAWAAQKVFFNPWNMVVGVRDVFGAVESLVDGYGGKSRTASLLNDSIDSGVRFLSQLAKGEDMDPKVALKAGWKSAGLLTGMVNAQELLFLEAFWDWLEDSNPDFELADLIRRKKK